MTAIGAGHYQVAAMLLFLIGVAGVLLRRNVLVVLLGLELMLNAANLSLVAFSRQAADPAGHVFALLVMVIAAVELAVGLAIVVSLVRPRNSLNLEDAGLMKW